MSMYGSSFDIQYVMHCALNMSIPIECLAQGSKLIRLTLPQFSITFLDIHRYIPQSLNNLAKTFNVGQQKGYFSFSAFADLSRWNCLSPFPDAEMFIQPQDDLKARQEKTAWVNQNQDQPFDICQEAVLYCMLDTDLLMKSSIRFIEQSLKVQDLLYKVILS